MIRDGALAFNTSRSRLVSRKWPRWFVAKVASSPSTVWTLLGRNIPALLMRTWSFLYLALKSCASSRTESLDDRSAVIASRFRLPVLALISMSVASPLSLSRETITTEAFNLARPIAVALPMPELPPVTRHTLPVMSTLLASKGGFTPGVGRTVGIILRVSSRSDSTPEKFRDDWPVILLVQFC